VFSICTQIVIDYFDGPVLIGLHKGFDQAIKYGDKETK
jgi:hypothetical protein